MRCHADWRVELVGDEGLTLTPCEVPGTGIVLELAGVRLDVSGSTAPGAVDALGLDAGFRGLYADSGVVRLLPQARFGALAGLGVEVRDLAVDPRGVTGTLRRHAPPEPAPDALVGELFGGAWRLGVGAVEVSLRENAVTGFLIAGRLGVPFLETPLDVGLGLRPAGSGFETTVHVGAAELTVPVGAGRVRLADLALGGTLGPDTVALAGAAEGIEIDLDPVRLTAGLMAFGLRHDPDGDELRGQLVDVPLGALGTVETAELVVAEHRTGGGAPRRRVRLESALAWADLSDRLGLPAGFPAPPDGRVATVFEWTQDGAGTRVTAVLTAELADADALWAAVPPAYRPEVESARLDVALALTDPAAFATAPVSGPLSATVSLSAAVRLPGLADLPGVLAVHTGDATGLVHGTATVTVDGSEARVALALADPVALEVGVPGPAGAPVVRLELDRMDVATGPTGEAALTLVGAAAVPALDDHLVRLAADLGLPAELGALAARLAGAVPDAAEAVLAVDFTGPAAEAALDVMLRWDDAPTVALLAELGRVADPAGTPQPDALPDVGVPDDFFAVTPAETRLAFALDDTPTLRLSGSFATLVCGESFDTTVAVELGTGDFAVKLTAGSSDPIVLTVPMPDPAALLGEANAAAVAATFDLDAGGREALLEIERFLTGLADALSAQGVLAFEVSDFGLTLTPAGVEWSGDLRLVQLPRLLEQLAPVGRLKAHLGAGPDQVFVTVVDTHAGDPEPLLSVPVPGDGDVAVQVWLDGFRLAYAWGRNEFAFGLDARVKPTRTLSLTAGGSGVHLPAVDANVSVGATVSAPPVPIPQGRLAFTADGTGALGELGLQAVVGTPGGLVTAYVREVAFSPTYFLLWPGLRGDAGFVVGGPDPRDLPDAAAYLDVRHWDRSAFFARATVTKGTLVLLDPMLGVMLNPLAAVPPFLTANPPYWVSPPLLMGDLYATEIGVSVNVPGLVFADLTFRRPLPAFSLQALLELAALAAGGFVHPIPAGSELRKVCYAEVGAALEVRLPGLTGAVARYADTKHVNVADLVNGVIALVGAVRSTLDAGAELVDELVGDPGALVRMVPRWARSVQQKLTVGGFELSGSLHLLDPEELRDELVLYHENRRRRPRGVAAAEPLLAPGPGPAIERDPVLVVTVPVGVRDLPDLRSLAPDLTFPARGQVAAAIEAQRARADVLQELDRGRRRQATRVARSLAEEVSALPNGQARRAALVRHGLGTAASAVETARRGRTGPAGSRQWRGSSSRRSWPATRSRSPTPTCPPRPPSWPPASSTGR